MNHKNPTERLAQVVDRVSKYWPSQRKMAAGTGVLRKRTSPPFTIAVSREAGTNAAAVARSVGERLGWAVYDQELVDHIAADMGVRTNLVESVDEKHQSWLLECLESFSSDRSVTESAYVVHLVETILSLGAHGECVIVGRGAGHVLPEANTLRVRLVAPLEDRIKAV